MDLKSLTDQELEQQRIDVLVEQERRKALAEIPEQIRDLTDKYLAGGGNLEDLQAEPPATE